MTREALLAALDPPDLLNVAFGIEDGKVTPHDGSETGTRKRAKPDKKEGGGVAHTLGVCDRCKRHGQECDEQAPCGYCSVGGFACERAAKKARAKAASATAHSKGGAASAELPRCENCRKGHRKCDRVTPCHECVSRGLKCGTATVARPAAAEVKKEEGIEVPAIVHVTSTPLESSEDAEGDLPCEECRGLHRRCDRKTPCSTCMTRGTTCTYGGGGAGGLLL